MCVHQAKHPEAQQSEESLYAMAKRIDKLFDRFNETMGWYDKFVKPKKAKKVKKDEDKIED